MDVLLDRLCLTRSRSEAKTACDTGAVSVDGEVCKASRGVRPGDRLEIRYPTRTLALELIETPARSVSRKTARELYRVLNERDDPAGS